MNLQIKKLILTLNLLTGVGIFIYFGGCTNTSTNVEKSSVLSTQIALLVPSESQNKNTNALALHLINSARLAVKDLDHLNLVLSVYPTSAEANRAYHVAKAAVERGAEIIIGPVFSNETAAVKTALQNTQIKIISLSNDPSVAGNNVFILGTTFQSSADRLVSFALSQDLQRIAIIGPEGEIGFNGINAAETSIDKNGAILTTVSSYPLSPKGIQSSASKIYEELVNSKTEAIIFTDTPTRGLAFIAEQIHQLYDKNNVKLPQFLGLTRWDSTMQILNEPALNNGWFIIPDQRFKKRYRKRYKNIFDMPPSDISFLSYDAIALIGGILQKNHRQIKTDKFNDKYFLDKNGFIGINGIFRFQTNGTNQRALGIAEVNSGAFTIINEAKNKF